MTTTIVYGQTLDKILSNGFIIELLNSHSLVISKKIGGGVPYTPFFLYFLYLGALALTFPQTAPEFVSKTAPQKNFIKKFLTFRHSKPIVYL